jgi:hypothetical protein
VAIGERTGIDDEDVVPRFTVGSEKDGEPLLAEPEESAAIELAAPVPDCQA